MGSTLGGAAVHRLGPRRVLLLQALPTIAGWLLQTFATGYPLLLTGWCLVGVCTGVSVSAGQVSNCAVRVNREEGGQCV